MEDSFETLHSTGLSQITLCNCTKLYSKLYQLAIMSCSFLKLVINLLMPPGMERVGEMYSTLIAFATVCSKKYSTSLTIAFP